MPALPAPDYPADVRARLEADAKEVIARYPDSRSALLPLLHLVQAEDGHVTRTGIRFCAELLDLTTAEVTAVSTFYSMYRRKAGGDYQVGVCTNTLCAVMGGDAIFEELQEHLGVGNGETTEDGAVTLEHIECNAACDFAPVVMVNWEFFDNQTPESARQLVDDLRAGRPVEPTRGAPLCTFKETARILAGFPDERPGAPPAPRRGRPPARRGRRPATGAAAPRPGAPGDHVVSPRAGEGGRPEEGTAGEPPGGHPGEQAPAGHPSSHDAPQETSASDTAHPSPTTAPDGGAPPRGDDTAGPTAEEGE
ncbi:NADH-quinone oxidoreductase subunit NuoE [Streptomyces sp. N2A]|uniref:NADH-quinone oxidoreductase subunit NuoE n=1 Tax=Streptomyces sp. N2A TaxID=3073936 RepID=UPI0028708D63|nr:NADH-quinone oxidoreductase subunit NuoE [Streptomyces sp. N2A]